MNWFKKAQYEVEDYQATPIPSMPQAAMGIRDNGEIIDPLPDTPEVSIDLAFENMHIDSHHGQDDYNLVARNQEDNAPMGLVEYTIYDAKIYINNMLVKEGFRRMGIGTAMINELKSLDITQGLKIHWGIMTDEGYALKQSLEK